MIKDNLKLTGMLYIKGVCDSGETKFEYTKHNMVVNGGIQLVTHTLMGDDINNQKITKFDVGDGSTATVDSMIALQGTNQLGVKNITSYTFPAWNQVKITFNIAMGEFNGYTMKEFGLFSENDVMFNRVVWSKDIVKASDFSVEGYFLITIS